MTFVRTLASLCLILTLAACGNRAVDVPYNAAAVSNRYNLPVLTVGDIKDSREDAGSNWLGAIRGGFGNPLKTLTTKEPVNEVVKTALIDGMKARGLYASAKPSYAISGVLHKFDCSQYARREAHFVLDVAVTNASQQTVFTKHVKVEKVNGSTITFDSGVFASLDDLHAIANEALQEGIDQLLDDPKFLAAIRA